MKTLKKIKQKLKRLLGLDRPVIYFDKKRGDWVQSPLLLYDHGPNRWEDSNGI